MAKMLKQEEDAKVLDDAADLCVKKMSDISHNEQKHDHPRNDSTVAFHNLNSSIISTMEFHSDPRHIINYLEDPISSNRGETTDLTSIIREQTFASHSKTTNCQTMMHLLKGNIGTGILAMPKAFSNAGLLIGTLGIPLLGVICIHCMHMLVNCSKILSKRIGCQSLDYPSVAEQAFKQGPPSFQKFSKVARASVNVFLMLTQFGFCCVYFVFVAKSIKEIYKSTSGSDDLSIYTCLAMVLPPMICYNFIRNLKQLSIASTAANILQAVGLCCIFYIIFQDGLIFESQPLTVSLKRLPLYFGTAVYAFEGIGVVLPLENDMATPKDFGGLTGVLNTGMVIVACLYTAVGFYGYLKYGDKSKGSITLNFPHSPLNEGVRIMFAVAIFLSYALQLYVPIQIIWPWLKNKFHLQEKFVPSRLILIEFVVRSSLVIFTFCLAILIPHLDLFISLVGAVASSFLALIFPPLIQIATYRGSSLSRGWLTVMIIKNVTISLFGLIGFIVGGYTSIDGIVTAFKNPTDEDD